MFGREVLFYWCESVCLSVCYQDNSISYWPISIKFGRKLAYYKSKVKFEFGYEKPSGARHICEYNIFLFIFSIKRKKECQFLTLKRKIVSVHNIRTKKDNFALKRIDLFYLSIFEVWTEEFFTIIESSRSLWKKFCNDLSFCFSVYL